MKNFMIGILFIFSIPLLVFSQSRENIIARVDSVHGDYWFNSTNNKSDQRESLLNSNLYGLGSAYGFKLINQHSDSLGSIYRYRQTYKGISIENSMFILHANNKGQFTMANGYLDSNINIANAIPEITANNAIHIAINAIPAQKYLWQDMKYSPIIGQVLVKVKVYWLNIFYFHNNFPVCSIR